MLCKKPWNRECVDIYRFLPFINIACFMIKKSGRGRISTVESSNLSYLHLFN